MDRKQTLRLSCTILWLAVLAFPECPAQDWPQWRGPGRDGVVAAPSAPASWPEQLRKRWQIQVGSGHSSPVVGGGRAYLHTRQGGQEVVTSLDLTSGRILWTDRYPAPYTMNPAATAHGKGPKSTPALSGGKLYTLGIAGTLTCYDAMSGRVRWRRETGATFKSSSPLYGTAMSPLVDGAAVIAHVGGQDSGALVSYDAETGRPRWSWKGDGPAYASPIVVEIEGVRQLVTQSQKHLVGVAAADGTLLWKLPYSTPWDQNAVTPLHHDGLLIFSGLEQGVLALRVRRASPLWTAERAWENREVSFYMSTPVLHGDSLIGLSHRKRGQFVSLDVRTGKVGWTGDGRAAEYAAVVLLGDTVLLLSDSAELTVARVSPARLEPMRRYTVARSPTWAHPVVVGRTILVKDSDTLALWSLD